MINHQLIVNFDIECELEVEYEYWHPYSYKEADLYNPDSRRHSFRYTHLQLSAYFSITVENNGDNRYRN